MKDFDYANKLITLTEIKRQSIIKSQVFAEVNSQGGGVQGANSSEERKSSQQSNQSQKTLVYQQKPKILIQSDYLTPKSESTLIKNYINNIIQQQLELFPMLGSSTQVKRTPYQQTRYNDKMTVFMKSLYNHIEKFPSIFDDLKTNIFNTDFLTINNINNIGSSNGSNSTSSSDTANLNAQYQEKYFKHPIAKQIFCLGEIIDEITDSSFQNVIQILDDYNLSKLNPAVLSVSYANLKVLEKSNGAVTDIPRLSFIQLGLQKQEFNKHFLYFNSQPNQNGSTPYQKKDQLTNIQYIDIYHQSTEGYKGKETEEMDHSDESDPKPEGYEQFVPVQNCFDIAINQYLLQSNEKNEKDEKDNQNIKFEELFIKNQQKCPKIIGQSEFLYLFEQVLRLVRNHKPNYIIFSYDFSLSKSHNHYYNLKPDVLGFFTYMLSQISNNHVIFVANTKDECHIFPEQLKKAESTQSRVSEKDKDKVFFGFDSFENGTNYFSISDQKKLKKFDSKQNDFEMIQDKQTETQIKTQVYQNKEELNNKPTDVDQNGGILTNNGTPETSASKGFCLDENKITSESKDAILKFLKWYQTGSSQGEYNKYLNYIQEKFFLNQNENNQLKKILAYDTLLVNKNLYQSIQEQLNSIIFSLIEAINYRKIILRQNLKTAIHVQVQFMSSITEQIRRSFMPIKSQSNKEQMKGIQNVKFTIQQIKYHDYMTKIKQIKHVADFVSQSNSEKVNLLQKVSQQKYLIPESTESGNIRDQIKANSNSMIINVMQQYPDECSEEYSQTLVSGLKKNVFSKLYNEQLKVKIMLKRYTQALLNNWVYDLRRNKKIYLNIQNKGDKVDKEMKFFFTERSQYVIDYDYDPSQRSNQIAIYFFNVQRGKHFKNYVLIEQKENQFTQEEIKYSVQYALDVNWKSIVDSDNKREYAITQPYFAKNQQANQEEIAETYQLQTQGQGQLEPAIQPDLQKKYDAIYIHAEELLNMEMFNSSLCITDKFIVKMFGEVINPTTWKQKEFSKMIFMIPRKQKNVNIENFQMKLLEQMSENCIFKSIPRSGCVSVYKKEQDVEKIYVFGGVSYNGYLCNFIEEYNVLNSQQQVCFTKVHYKKLSQKTFRPLYSPFTFIHQDNIYFLGGEVDKNLISRAFNQVYLQQYSLAEGVFKPYQIIDRKNIKSDLKLKGQQDQKQHQREFLKFVEVIPFQTVSLNTYYSFNQNNQKVFSIALVGKCNSAIEQILEKSTTIQIQLSLIENFMKDKKQTEKLIQIETTLEDESEQELRLNEHNSSKTFFLSSFQADQSTILDNNKKNENSKQQQGPSTSNQIIDDKTSNLQKNQIAELNDKTTTNNQDQTKSSRTDQGGMVQNEKTNLLNNVPTLNQHQTTILSSKQNQPIEEERQILGSNKKFKDLVEYINSISKNVNFQTFTEKTGSYEKTGTASYLNFVKTEFYFQQEEKFVPKYFLVQNNFSKLVNIIVGVDQQNQLSIAHKFSLTIRFNDEDYKDSLLSNQMHFISYYPNMEKRQMIFYKTLSLEEITELSQTYSNFKSDGIVYKQSVKFDQQKMSMLSLQEEALEVINPQLINRYVVADSEYIYLINGTNSKDPNLPYNKLSPCERYSLKKNQSEELPECIFLDSKKSQILQNEYFIFYIGLYENQEEILEDDQIEEQGEQSEEEDSEDDDQSEQLIAQIFDKKKKFWKIIRLSQCKEITKKFNNFTFLLGNQENRVFAVNNRLQPKKKDTIANHEITFDLNRGDFVEDIHHVAFNWKGQKQVDIIRSSYYSATAYGMLPSNPISYETFSLIPKQSTRI